jgi:hypothetical protein
LTHTWRTLVEKLAQEGLVSAYSLHRALKISTSHAQWWLSYLERLGLARVYLKESKGRRTTLYGLTDLGFLMAVKHARVRRNFVNVFSKFVDCQDVGAGQTVKVANRKLKQNLLDALKSPEVADRYRDYFLSVSNALDDLTDIYSLDDSIVIQLAVFLAAMKEPEKMRLFFRDVSPKVTIVQRMMEAYQQAAMNLPKIVRGEVQ